MKDCGPSIKYAKRWAATEPNILPFGGTSCLAQRRGCGAGAQRPGLRQPRRDRLPRFRETAQGSLRRIVSRKQSACKLVTPIRLLAGDNRIAKSGGVGVQAIARVFLASRVDGAPYRLIWPSIIYIRLRAVAVVLTGKPLVVT
jgi:hypothetical protein